MLSPKVFLSELVTLGYMSEETASKLELDALKTGAEIEDVVSRLNIAPLEAILHAKAKCLNVESVNISQTAVSPQAIELLPIALARRYEVVPFKLDEASSTIYIATADPLNLNVQSFLEQKTALHVHFVLAHRDDILKVINTAYAQNFGREVSQAVTEKSKQTVSTVKTQELRNDDSPITKIIDTIMQYASESRSSDVHIEPQKNQTRVRYRIDGQLQEKLVLPASIHESLISRIKVMSGLKLDERRLPQDGRFGVANVGAEVDVRVSTLPTTYGEKAVLRLLRKSGGVPTLESLGLQNINLKAYQKAIAHPYGIVLITGPTGSGKTTTLYSTLSILNKPNLNIVTLEDPIEYELPGVNQVQVNVQAGLTFASGLRSFLRQDPNVILVGEIRDSETTALAVQAALTGHLVFSTLHTNNAATAIPRLIDLGAEPFLISSVIVATVAQRIARRICDSCKITYAPDAALEVEIKNTIFGNTKSDQKFTLARGRGCEKCNNTGYYGRVGIYEVLNVTPNINKLILAHAPVSEIESQAIADGMITMRQDGYLKAIAGLTTIDEVTQITQI